MTYPQGMEFEGHHVEVLGIPKTHIALFWVFIN